MSVPSYASPFALGHRAIADLFDGEVVVQEKIDGSQFSFCVRLVDGVRILECRSKGAELHVSAPDKMFAKGVATVQALADSLTPGYVYRGEYLQKPKHNVLAYDRTPAQNVILFDIEDRNLGEGYFLPPTALAAEAARLGLEAAPVLFQGTISDPQRLRDLLETVSCLGGAKIEGVVVKNYAKFTNDKKVMMGKFVSEAFKEVHAGEWRKENPTQGDVVAQLVAAHKTPARWAKAVQHLKEAGRAEGSPKDIGLLIKEVGEDIERECSDQIREALFAHFWPQIRRAVTGGLPEWYKDQLMQEALRQNPEDVGARLAQEAAE